MTSDNSNGLDNTNVNVDINSSIVSDDKSSSNSRYSSIDIMHNLRVRTRYAGESFCAKQLKLSIVSRKQTGRACAQPIVTRETTIQILLNQGSRSI